MNMSPLIFLLKLAWESRFRLPLLIYVGFMAFDVRMQLEINVSMRRVRRNRDYMSIRGQNENQSDSETDSWLTEEEEEYTLSSSDDTFEPIPGTSQAIDNLRSPLQTFSNKCSSDTNQVTAEENEEELIEMTPVIKNFSDAELNEVQH